MSNLSLEISEEIELARALVRGKRVLVLTGAGISTDSGIPDYRGEGRVQKHPLTYDDFMGSESNRARYWARSFVGFNRIAQAIPNPGHLALAKAELSEKITGIITQNVDGLHQKAGSREVLELHGRLDQIHCVGCNSQLTRAEMDVLIQQLNPELDKLTKVEFSPDGDAEIEVSDTFRVPNCKCGKHFKPNVVFFGEQVPKDRVAHAAQLIVDSQVVLVAGSSLTVNSGLRLVKQAHNQDKPVIVVNIGSTRADTIATCKIEQSTSLVLEEIFS